MTTVLITGASSGIGLEFVRQYASRNFNVIATCRRPETAADLQDCAKSNSRVSIKQLDVTDRASVARLAEEFGETPIDILINNAGIFGGTNPQQCLGELDYDLAHAVVDTNVFGTLRVVEALLENVARSSGKKIMAISSLEGSLTTRSGTGHGGLYFYRMSKSALNMAMVTLANDVADKGIIVGTLSPGVVVTNLGKSAGIDMADLGGMPAKKSVAGLIDVIESFDLGMSGQFMRYTGERAPW